MAGEFPTRIGPYTIALEIGRGGMGVVYLARDERLDRDVAIKALPEHFADDPARLERFQREARTLAQLNHPNVAGIYGVEEHAGAQYLVLEYVEGETLADMLDRGPLNIHDTIDICTKIALGVEAAHDANIIHRDLKPANVKITPDGKVKVLDFGLARIEEHSSSTSYSAARSNSPTLTSPMQHSPTIPGAILGTAAYMSPEQARGRRVDKRTDIWSFGVLLYECLTGASPFVGETVRDSIGAVLHKHIDMHLLPVDTPPGIRRLIARCVERDKNQRYRDIADVRLELNRAFDEPIEPPATEVVSRRTAPQLAIVAVLLIAFAATGYFGANALRPETPKPVARFDVITESEDLRLQRPEPRISPDGTLIAYLQDNEIRVRHLASFNSRILSGTKGAERICWSPDADWIGYTANRAAYKVSLTGGNSIKLTGDRIVVSGAGGIAWTADDRIFFVTEKGIMSVSARGGEPTLLMSDDVENLIDYHDVSTIPDSNVILYVEHRRDMSFVVSAHDGDRSVVIAQIPDSQLVEPTWSPSGHVLFARGPGGFSIWAVKFDPVSMSVLSDPFLVEPIGENPSVSWQGTLALRRGRNDFEGSLAIVSRVGDVESIGGNFEVNFRSILTRDGTRIAFSAGTANKVDVWVHDLQRHTNTRMTFFEGLCAPVAWSPDGLEIAVARFDPESRPGAKTYFFYANGSGESRPTLDGALASLDDTWSTAARILNVMSEEPTLLAISMDDPETTINELKVNHEGLFEMKLSPDGTLLAYTSDESDSDEIYCTRFPDGTGKWQVSTSGGRSPVWSADGSRLCFESSDDDEKAIYQAEVTLEPSLQFGLPELVLDDDALDLNLAGGWYPSADGERFVVVQKPPQSPGTRVSISVIQNWYEEFRNK